MNYSLIEIKIYHPNSNVTDDNLDNFDISSNKLSNVYPVASMYLDEKKYFQYSKGNEFF